MFVCIVRIFGASAELHTEYSVFGYSAKSRYGAYSYIKLNGRNVLFNRRTILVRSFYKNFSLSNMSTETKSNNFLP